MHELMDFKILSIFNGKVPRVERIYRQFAEFNRRNRESTGSSSSDYSIIESERQCPVPKKRNSRFGSGQFGFSPDPGPFGLQGYHLLIFLLTSPHEET